MDRFISTCLLLAGLITAWPVAAQSNSPAGSSSAPVLLIAPATLFFAATNGTIAPPFAVVADAVSQPIESGVADGGRATYGFTITNAGAYVISAEVNASTKATNAFYFSVDTEPLEPIAIWDVSPTTGFANQLVTWRGEKSPASPAPVPKVFQLAAGNHLLIVGGKAAGTQLKSLTLLPYADKPPSPTNLRVISAQ
jgi:hypothetical protein